MRLLFFVLLGYIVYRLISSRKQVSDGGNHRPQATETYKDPVCGVYVSADDAVIGRYEGERIYFCSPECLEKYREHLPETNK